MLTFFCVLLFGLQVSSSTATEQKYVATLPQNERALEDDLAESGYSFIKYNWVA